MNLRFRRDGGDRTSQAEASAAAFLEALTPVDYYPQIHSLEQIRHLEPGLLQLVHLRQNVLVGR